MNTKYIVWVGGIDDHYTSEEEAKKAQQEWIDDGYDDVQIEVEHALSHVVRMNRYADE